MKAFKRTVREYYKKHGRHDLPWRQTRDPYKILVSEIMLQQTQVSRVIEKYTSFLQKFPTVEALAHASLRDVLTEWQGLGYNRRGLYLKKCAEKIVAPKSAGGFDGKFPKDFKTLCTLPGIGPATAGDIMAFAWNRAVPVIETNIRSVFIHFFFPENKTGAEQKKISDSDIMPLIEESLCSTNRKNSREWYWALFDYGAYLKSSRAPKNNGGKNPSRRSAHHIKQSAFEGSNRQKRAAILRLILEKPRTEKELLKVTKYTPEILATNLKTLALEGLLKKQKQKYIIF